VRAAQKKFVLFLPVGHCPNHLCNPCGTVFLKEDFQSQVLLVCPTPDPMQFLMIIAVSSRRITAVPRIPHLVCGGIPGFSCVVIMNYKSELLWINEKIKASIQF
jgi:hypothetical protein